MPSALPNNYPLWTVQRCIVPHLTDARSDTHLRHLSSWAVTEHGQPAPTGVDDHDREAVPDHQMVARGTAAAPVAHMESRNGYGGSLQPVDFVDVANPRPLPRTVSAKRILFRGGDHPDVPA